MNHNAGLVAAYELVSATPLRIRNRVKEIMNWKSDRQFYDRVNGRVKCSPAEELAFQMAFSEIKPITPQFSTEAENEP